MAVNDLDSRTTMERRFTKRHEGLQQGPGAWAVGAGQVGGG